MDDYQYDDWDRRASDTNEQQQFNEEHKTMKISAKGSGTFEQAPTGTELARCIRLIDIGTQKSDYQGRVSFPRKVIVMWELPNTKMESGDHAGQPFVISRFYTASLSEKATLRKDLISWRGKEFTADELDGFELRNILNAPCMLNLIANDSGKTVVAAIMALPKGMQVPPPVNPLTYFSLDEFDPGVFGLLSDGIKKLIEASPEYKAVTQQAPMSAAHIDVDQDIPF